MRERAAAPSACFQWTVRVPFSAHWGVFLAVSLCARPGAVGALLLHSGHLHIEGRKMSKSLRTSSLRQALGAAPRAPHPHALPHAGLGQGALPPSPHTLHSCTPPTPSLQQSPHTLHSCTPPTPLHSCTPPTPLHSLHSPHTPSLLHSPPHPSLLHSPHPSLPALPAPLD